MKNWITEITLFFGVFSLIFVGSFSFPFQVLPNVGGWLEPMFNQWVDFDANLIGVRIANYHSGEDSEGMWVNVINVLLLSVVLFVSLTFSLNRAVKDKIVLGIYVFLRYYLALILLIYGFDKVYKWQFYSPESNILFTRVKDLPQDMLYWTTMGTSYSYSLITGSIEVLAAILLLFRKTSVLGMLIGFGALINVFIVNIGFDITIKIFSGFLVLVCLILLLPYLKSLIVLLTGREGKLALTDPDYCRSSWYKILKFSVLVIFLVESQYKFVIAGNFNDDLASRPHFNGAYEVIAGSPAIKRIHFHRDGYFILEMVDEKFLDHKMTLYLLDQKISLSDYNGTVTWLDFEESNDTLKLSNTDGSFSVVTVKQPI